MSKPSRTTDLSEAIKAAKESQALTSIAQQKPVADETPSYSDFMITAATLAGTCLATIATMVYCFMPKTPVQGNRITLLPGNDGTLPTLQYTDPSAFAIPGNGGDGFDPLGQAVFHFSSLIENDPTSMPYVKNLAFVAASVGIAYTYYYYTDSNTTQPAGESPSADNHL